MGYLGNKLQGKYHKDTFQTAVNMAWPAIVESFFIAFAGLVGAVRNFDPDRWDAACYDIVKAGNLAKFSQNPELWDYLKSTGTRILVEASPRDRIWGIGMGKSNPDAADPAKWRGTNLLGFALTEVRDILLEKESGGSGR